MVVEESEYTATDAEAVAVAVPEEFPLAIASAWNSANVFLVEGGLTANTIPLGQCPVCLQ